MKARDQRVETRISVGVHGLYAGGIVDVSDGGNFGAYYVELVDAEELLLLVGHAPAALTFDVGNQEHVGRIGVELEPVGNVLAQHRGRERAETLAVFYPQIERLLHIRRARIAEHRAGSERARPELHAALHPADGLASGK